MMQRCSRGSRKRTVASIVEEEQNNRWVVELRGPTLTLLRDPTKVFSKSAQGANIDRCSMPFVTHCLTHEIKIEAHRATRGEIDVH